MSKSVVAESHHVMSNIENNNNKFWRIFRYDDNSCRVEFGRVGDSGQSKDHLFSSEYDAISFFNKKTNEKEHKGYHKVEIISATTPTKVIIKDNLTEVAKKQINTSSTQVQKLIEYFSKVNVHNILESTAMKYDVDSGLFSTPVGIVTKDTVDKARIVLNDMLPFVKDKKYHDTTYCNLLQDYLMLIPKDIGRRFDPESIFNSETDLVAQSSILDSLEASIQSVLASPVTDDGDKVVQEKQIFNVTVELLNDSTEFNRISKFFKSTKHNNHASSKYELKNVYSIKIDHMLNEFNLTKDIIGNVKELWHGTKASNILSILKSGLVMPNPNSSNFCGAVFGLGLYFSDQSTKSLNYATNYWTSGGNTSRLFMFLADVAMGKEYTPSGPSSNLPKAGYDSTFAIGGRSGVMNNEMIVYKLKQCNLKYLCEFE